MTVYKDNMKTDADADAEALTELDDFSKEINEMDGGKMMTSNAEELALQDVLASMEQELDELVMETIVPEDNGVIVEASDVLADDELRDLDLAIDRQEAYAEQESLAIGTVAPPAPGTGKTKTTRKTKVVGAGDPKVPTVRVERDLKDVPAEFFVLEGAPADLEANKLTTIALLPTQVKIAEKFENLFVNLAAGKKPSSYTMQAFMLLEAHGTISSADLIGAYKTAGLGEGTARSQAGQMLALFNVVGIAKRTGHSLTINPVSALAQRIRDLSAGAPTA